MGAFASEGQMHLAARAASDSGCRERGGIRDRQNIKKYGRRGSITVFFSTGMFAHMCFGNRGFPGKKSGGSKWEGHWGSRLSKHSFINGGAHVPDVYIVWDLPEVPYT